MRDCVYIYIYGVQTEQHTYVHTHSSVFIYSAASYNLYTHLYSLATCSGVSFSGSGWSEVLCTVLVR